MRPVLTRPRLATILLVFAAAAAAAAPITGLAEGGGLPPWQAVWRAAAEPALGAVVAPVDLALAPDGSLVVVDRELRRVQRFAADGRVLGAYRLPGRPFLTPLAVAVDPVRERVYVSDSERATVASFTLAGDFLTEWADFQQPEALAWGEGGRVHVYDRRRSGLLTRSPEGEQALDNIPVQVPQSFASELPNGLAVDAQGQIWFAAEAPVVTLPPILYVFDRQGDIAPPRTRLDFNPRDLAFDRAGRGFMLDGLGARLVTDFDRRSGSYLALPIQRGARALAAGSAGEVWLLDGPSSEHEGGISGLTVTGQRATEQVSWRFPSLAAGWYQQPTYLAAAGSDICLADGTHRLQWLDAAGGGLAQARRPFAAAVAGLPDGDCFVARARQSNSLDDAQDPDVAPVGTQRLTLERHRRRGAVAERVWTRDWTEPLTASPPSSLTALAVDAAGGRLVLLDASARRLRFFDLAGGEPRGERLLPPAAGFAPWNDVEVDGRGRIWVLDFVRPGLLVLDAEGALLRELPAPAGAFRLAVLPSGDPVVLTARRELVQLDAEGRETARTVLPAPAAGDSRPPGDLTVDGAGRLLVTDPADAAIHVFGPLRRPGGLWLPWLGGGADVDRVGAP
ncbi:MAG TPA: hypothetical protein PK826_05310 [Anaerolineae bacterium]|mgnify:CR=1 FL=1|nr:hypothetical protein [Anaerolineae bacterium]HRA19131.1 hypothetical protein [Anaerolineae bacterium]